LRVFVAGASGFIGHHVASALLAAGATVVGGARDPARAARAVPGIEWVAVDFNSDIDPAIWRGRLAGFDALVNCVGVLQSGWRGHSRRVHVEAADDLQALVRQPRSADKRGHTVGDELNRERGEDHAEEP